MEKMFGNPMEKFKKMPPASQAEIEAARRAAEKAVKEREEKLAKEQAEHEETERLSRLWRQDAAEKSGPHVITKEDMEEAEKTVGKKFENFN